MKGRWKKSKGSICELNWNEWMLWIYILNEKQDFSRKINKAQRLYCVLCWLIKRLHYSLISWLLYKLYVTSFSEKNSPANDVTIIFSTNDVNNSWLSHVSMRKMHKVAYTINNQLFFDEINRGYSLFKVGIRSCLLLFDFFFLSISLFFKFN